MPTAYAQLPVPADIKFIAGDDVEIMCTLSEGGTAIDLTLYSYVAYIVFNDGSKVPFTILQTLLTAGQITLTLSRALTVGMNLGEYTWYLQITDLTTNYTRTWSKGACIIS